jgi:hypothetical protein
VGEHQIVIALVGEALEVPFKLAGNPVGKRHRA